MQGTDERVALAKAAYRMVQQIQTVVASTVFGGQQHITGEFSADYVIGSDAKHNLLTITVNMLTDNLDFNVDSDNFNVNTLRSSDFGENSIFAGVTNLNLEAFNDVSSTDLGIFSTDKIHLTLQSLSHAINNVNKVASYLGGVVNRLTSQEDLLQGQITNYHAAISRIEDANIAEEQLDLVKQQILQQASIVSLALANANPQAY